MHFADYWTFEACVSSSCPLLPNKANFSNINSAHCCQEFFAFSFDFLLKETTSPLLQALLELKLPPLQKALELCQEKKPSYPWGLAGYFLRLTMKKIKNPQCILLRLVSPTAPEGDIQRKRDCWFPIPDCRQSRGAKANTSNVNTLYFT